MLESDHKVNVAKEAEKTAKVDDFIQKAVNAGYQQSMERAIKKIKYKRQRYNERMNKKRKARKLERNNRRKGRK